MNKYKVVWVNLITGKVRANTVLIVDGETTVDDIPKILATRYMRTDLASFVQVLDRHPVS